MTFAGVLTVHILTAALTGLILLYSLYILSTTRRDKYQLCMLLIGFVASLEVVTGVLLAQLSPTLTATSLSTHMLEYLGVCLFVEAILYFRTKKFLRAVVL